MPRYLQFCWATDVILEMHASIPLLLIGNGLTGRINEINLLNAHLWNATSLSRNLQRFPEPKKASQTPQAGCQAYNNWPSLSLQPQLVWSPPVDPSLQTGRTGGQSLLSAFFLPFLPHYLLLYYSDLHFNILFQTKVMVGPKKAFFFPLEVCVCVCVCVCGGGGKKHITKFTSLTIIKCAARWHYIHSHCYANTTIQLQTLYWPQN